MCRATETIWSDFGVQVEWSVPLFVNDDLGKLGNNQVRQSLYSSSVGDLTFDCEFGHVLVLVAAYS